MAHTSATRDESEISSEGSLVPENLRHHRVEMMGLEPTTPCLQSRCSSQLSYIPGTISASAPL
jgi:hypothetical protein